MHYFAIGTTLANLTNLEALTGYAPHVLPAARIPLRPPNARRVLSGAVVRTGAVAAPMQWDVMKLSDLRALVTTYWGDAKDSAALFASWLDETGRYSPFAVTVQRPYIGEHYQINDSVWAKEIALNAFDWRLQSVTKTANYTVTTSDRLIYANTGGGSITLTLPAAAAPNANTVFSFVKTSAANTLTVQRAGTDTLDGGTSVSLTALNARLDVVSDGISAWVSV